MDSYRCLCVNGKEEEKKVFTMEGGAWILGLTMLLIGCVTLDMS